jgi:hypothetical protein
MQAGRHASLSRNDVFELRLRLDWIILATDSFTEKSWGLQLQLVGVVKCSGRRINDTHSVIKGSFDTHPSVSIELQLKVDNTKIGDVEHHKLTSYKVDNVSYH